MKKEIMTIVESYLQIFKDEQKRQDELLQFLNKTEEQKITDWNNFCGHIVASVFIYAKREKRFLVLYHKDLKMYLYPGGHIDKEDKDILEAAKRELQEETGITKFKQLLIKNKKIPIDISSHTTPYNKRLNLPKHRHFDFRYLFMIEKIVEIKQDTEELGDYKWIDLKELSQDKHYGKISKKIEKVLNENK